MNNICDKDHSNLIEILRDIPEDQGGYGRHKCAGCAYDKGFMDGRNGLDVIDLEKTLSELKDSQKSPLRHKSATFAYTMGYAHGHAARKIKTN